MKEAGEGEGGDTIHVMMTAFYPTLVVYIVTVWSGVSGPKTQVPSLHCYDRRHVSLFVEISHKTLVEHKL